MISTVDKLYITKEQFIAMKKNHTVKECTEKLGMTCHQVYYLFGDILKELKEKEQKSLYNSVKEYAVAGKRKIEILNKFNIGTSTLNRLMKKYGEIEFNKGFNKGFKKERALEVIGLFESGVSQSEVGRRFGISRQRVKQILNRMEKER